MNVVDTLTGRPASRSKADEEIAARLAALEQVLTVGGSRLEPAAAERGRAVVARTGERIRRGLSHTVVAFAGATGSGKSSLFNAVAGTDVSAVGVTRPTTSKATGLVVGPGGDDLLDWLAIPRRHRIDPSVFGRDGNDLAGLVLLDLPDHDSTAVAHRLEVDRLVALVDLMVWVVDPQKYADDALHAGYLRPMAAHAGVMVIVLNQIDRLPAGTVDACLADLRKLCAEDGLGQVPVLGVSARTGEGLDQLRDAVARAVSARGAVTNRFRADLADAAAKLVPSVADTELDPDKVPGRRGLIDVLADAAGVDSVLAAVDLDYRRQARLRTGWPFTRWVSHLRRSPLRRLGLGTRSATGRGELEPGVVDRSSLPAPSQGQQAQVALATRRIATECGQGLPLRWADAVRAAAVPPGPDLADALDRAITRVRYDTRKPLWWSVIGLLQLLLAATAVLGGLWLAGLALMAYLQLPDPATPQLLIGQLAIPLPTVMVVGGLVLGPLLSLLVLPLIGVGAALRRRRAAKAVREGVAQVANSLVLEPVSKVLADHRIVRTQLKKVRSRR